MRKPVTAVGILLASLVLATGCGGGSQRASSGVETSTAAAAESSPTETTTTEVTRTSMPIRCLDAAGLTAVEWGGAGGPWSGSSDDSTYRIVVHKLAKPAREPRVVAGEYAVTGSFKVVAVGRGLTGDEGLQADSLVQIVADCLGD
jgi:hypothetical protein